MVASNSRRPVSKTWKLYMKGAFVRSESGMTRPQHDRDGQFFAHVPQASRKDFRDAVKAARSACEPWWKKTAFLRSQILFRIAEMLEDRAALYKERLMQIAGRSEEDAEREVGAACDRIFWYAGWADKIDSTLGSVNRVAAPFFNFTLAEPCGTAVVFVSRKSPLLGLVSDILPPLVAGNAVIAISDHDAPVIPLGFGEVLATSDVPAGVVQVLTGSRSDLLKHAAGHMDVDAIGLTGGTEEERRCVGEEAAENVKRVVLQDDFDLGEWCEDQGQSLYRIEKWLEWKTAWHPMGA